MNDHKQNLYAFDKNFNPIYIGDVKYEDKGTAKEYYCMGCRKTMQAVKSLKDRQDYFRHHVTKNNSGNKCTYSDETYRHKLAKEQLQYQGCIKVPALYKYPPKVSSENKAVLIDKEQIIRPSKILIEKGLYENDAGEIKISSPENIDKEKHLYIVPDAIFLDKNDKPILLIEFVATHKSSQIKLMKIKRLGVNAVQVNIPKSSPEEIKNCLQITNRTKWLFNKKENESEYLQVSNKNEGGVHPIDDIQRTFFEEGFKCRSAQIGEFIRAIEKILGTERYRTIKRNLTEEIQRVENNSRSSQSKLEGLHRENRELGLARNNPRREKVEERNRRFRETKTDLEGRYLRKKEELDDQQRVIESEQREVDKQLDEIEAQPTVEELIEREQEKERNLADQIERIEQLKREEQEGFEREGSELREYFESETARIDGEIKEIENRRKTLPELFRKKGEQSEEEFGRNEKELRERFEENRNRLCEDLNKGDASSVQGVKAFYYRVSELKRLASNYDSYLKVYRRFEKDYG